MDLVLKELGGAMSHLWILLRLSGPGWHYGEEDYYIQGEPGYHAMADIQTK